MHILSASLAVVLCTAAGLLKAKNAESGRTNVRSFLSDIRSLSAQMDFTSETIEVCIGKIRKSSAAESFWSDMQKSLSAGKTCEEAWDEAYARSKELFSAYDEDETAELYAFFSSLGRSDRETEKQKSALLCAMLEKAQTRTEDEAKRSARLWRSLGALIGVGLAIIII